MFATLVKKSKKDFVIVRFFFLIIRMLSFYCANIYHEKIYYRLHRVVFSYVFNHELLLEKLSCKIVFLG